MKIGSIDLDQEVLVVAEIGNNHEGSYALAEEMIGLAAKAGAQAVKFQTFKPEHYVWRNDPARLERLRKFALTYEQFAGLAKTAARAGVVFLSTPFDLASADALNEICPAIKISSGDNVFFPLIERVASFKKPILMSCGLAEIGDVESAIQHMTSVWQRANHNGEVVLLHCVSSYPTPPHEANVAAIHTLGERFGRAVGYSDHTLGVEAAVLSVAMGARVIEKHFTLDKNHSDFRDHQISADPAELAELVRRVKLASALLGDGRKTAQPSEASNHNAMRRSIAAGRDLIAGTVLEWNDLTWVRPGSGIAPGSEATVLGRRVKRDLRQGELISAEDVG